MVNAIRHDRLSPAEVEYRREYGVFIDDERRPHPLLYMPVDWHRAYGLLTSVPPSQSSDGLTDGPFLYEL